jgi:hypothetical protein
MTRSIHDKENALKALCEGNDAQPELLYFVTTHGYLQTFKVIPSKEWGMCQPQVGCDILTRDGQGFIASGKSWDYSKTAIEAVSKFIEERRRAIALYRRLLMDEHSFVARAESELLKFNRRVSEE